MPDEVWLFVICLHLIGYSVVCAVYGLWTFRWLRRSAWTLAFLNGAVLVVGIFLTYVYLVAFADVADAVSRFKRDGPVNSIITLLLVLPALARFLELRRTHDLEAQATEVAEAMTRGDI